MKAVSFKGGLLLLLLLLLFCSPCKVHLVDLAEMAVPCFALRRVERFPAHAHVEHLRTGMRNCCRRRRSRNAHACIIVARLLLRSCGLQQETLRFWLWIGMQAVLLLLLLLWCARKRRHWRCGLHGYLRKRRRHMRQRGSRHRVEVPLHRKSTRSSGEDDDAAAAAAAALCRAAAPKDSAPRPPVFEPAESLENKLWIASCLQHLLVEVAMRRAHGVDNRNSTLQREEHNRLRPRPDDSEGAQRVEVRRLRAGPRKAKKAGGCCRKLPEKRDQTLAVSEKLEQEGAVVEDRIARVVVDTCKDAAVQTNWHALLPLSRPGNAGRRNRSAG